MQVLSLQSTYAYITLYTLGNTKLIPSVPVKKQIWLQKDKYTYLWCIVLFVNNIQQHVARHLLLLTLPGSATSQITKSKSWNHMH